MMMSDGGMQGPSEGVFGYGTPKISPSELLWGKDDVRTAIEHEYFFLSLCYLLW